MVRDADPYTVDLCLGLVSEALLSCDELAASALRKARESLERGDTFCTYAWLKLALEAAIQRTYYTLMGIP